MKCACGKVIKFNEGRKIYKCECGKEYLRKTIKIKKISENEIEFDDGSILTSSHERDCCEVHYLDFSNLSAYNIDTTTGKTINIYEREFDFSNGVSFKKVEGVGILLIDIYGSKYLVNGYGFNNGYYGTDITLVYRRPEKKTLTYDVSKCQNIEWC